MEAHYKPEDEMLEMKAIGETLVRRRYLIIAVTLCITIAAAIYAYSIKPVYRGGAILEIGEVVVGSRIGGRSIVALNNAEDLQTILEARHGVNIDIPMKTFRILRLSYSSTDRNKIRAKLQETIDDALALHEEKAKWYTETAEAQVRMTRQVGEITIPKKPVKPKKIITIFLGFIGGVFLAFVLAFLLEAVHIGKRSDK